MRKLTHKQTNKRQVDKSPNDPRSYRAISLASGMKVRCSKNVSRFTVFVAVAVAVVVGGGGVDGDDSHMILLSSSPNFSPCSQQCPHGIVAYVQ